MTKPSSPLQSCRLRFVRVTLYRLPLRSIAVVSAPRLSLPLHTRKLYLAKAVGLGYHRSMIPIDIDVYDDTK